MIPPGPIVSLVYRVPASRREGLFDFLRGAIPFYERPGRIRVGLFESADEPGLYLELVAYANEEAYAADQDRVERDREMLSTLDRFKAAVGGPVEVRRMRPVGDLEIDRSGDPEPGISPAAFNDHAAIAALLGEAGLSAPEAEEPPVRMLVARSAGRVVGCAGWERHGEVALLRSVAVREALRKQGIGRALVRAALGQIAAEGSWEVVLLTEGKERFFREMGFRKIEREALPEATRASRQVAGDRCRAAVVMRRDLGS